MDLLNQMGTSSPPVPGQQGPMTSTFPIQQPLQPPPGAITQFPTQTQIQYPYGEPPPIATPDSQNQGGFLGGLGQVLGTVNKVASNPLLLAALKGYGTGLAMPRGAGPITRIVGGLGAGLEDYYVDTPYRQAATERERQATETAEEKTAEARLKRQDLEKLSPEERQVAEFPSLAGLEKSKAAEKLKEQQRQSLVPQYRAQAQALQTSNPQMAQVYEQGAAALEANADPKDVAAMIRIGQQGQHQAAMEGLAEEGRKIQERQAAIAAGHLRVSEGELAARKGEQAFREKEYQEGAPEREATKQLRQAQLQEAQIKAQREQEVQDWVKTQPPDVQERYKRIMTGLEAKPKAAGTERPVKVETFNPETGTNEAQYIAPSEVTGKTYTPKKDVQSIRAINALKIGRAQMDMLRELIQSAPDQRGYIKAKYDKFLYSLGAKVPEGDRNEQITQTGAVIQTLQQMAIAAGNSRAASALKDYKDHFPQYGDEDAQVLSKLDQFDKNMDIVADALGYTGGIKSRGKRPSGFSGVSGGGSSSVSHEDLLRQMEQNQ